MTASAHLALATFLAGVSLVGTPLYVSSSASAAAQDQLAHTCRSDDALDLTVPAGADISDVAAIGSRVPLVDPPIFVIYSRVTLQSVNGLPQSLVLLTRDGDAAHVTPPLHPLGPNEVALPHDVLRGLDAQIGDHLTAEVIGGATVDLVIAQTFDDLPFRPEPDFWCGFKDLLRPSPIGDPAPNWGLVAASTQAAFARQGVSWLEYRPTDAAITMHQARQMEAGYGAAAAAHHDAYGQDRVSNSLSLLLDHASGLATGVERSVAPARLAGLVAAFLTLMAAAAFVAEEREQELRLFAIRGEPPWRVALHLLPRLSVPIVIGGLFGYLAALIAVRALGPTSVVERGVLVDCALVLAAATSIALAVVTTYVALLGDRLVDRRRSRGWWRHVPIELAAVPIAVVSYRRLVDGGALQMFGVNPGGGELLAQGFPMFGLIAIAAVMYRPLQWLATRLRTSGSRLPRAVRLGFRRVILDPRASAMLVIVFVIAGGCFTTSRLLSQTAERELHDKADNYVGADVAVGVYGDVPRSALVDAATEVSRVSGHLDGASVAVLGVDRATFAQVALMRDDAASVPLSRLLDQIAPSAGTALPAILVGGDSLDASLGDSLQIATTLGRPDISVTVVAQATFFPGSASGVSVVVDREALEHQIDFAQQSIWFAHPPPDIVERLRADGVKVGLVTRSATVFDTTNYRAQTWSYVPLGALSVLFVLIALGLQLLIVSARRTGRQQANVVMQRTGFRARSLWLASLIEVAVPTIIGTALGTIAGIVLSRAAIGHLDSLPTIAPPPRLVVGSETFIISGIAVVLMIIAVAGIVVRSTLHSDPMKAIRGFASD